ncbi:hypothetical protein [Arenimonas malthae]|uniref:hypothetical protein n=1 Tax=Arenimonas malthae TaxID=354197 RepID=UPI0012EC00BB|nr:hypothetical protein [Arenimonas malthae]
MHLAYGAKPFAQDQSVESDDEDDGPINRGYYEGWLRYTLSEKLIEVSIKTRVVMDMIVHEKKRWEADGEVYPVDPERLDQEISEKHPIASASSGVRITVRECCNKIIHASEIAPIYEVADEEHNGDEEAGLKRQWSYWTGGLDLTGTHQGAEWHYQIEVAEFCSALVELLSDLEDQVDWNAIDKD